MVRKSFGEGGAAFDLVGEVAKDLEELRGVAAGLALKRAHGADERQTGFQQRGQLTRHGGQILARDFGHAESHAFSAFGGRLAGVRGFRGDDGGREQLLLLQRIHGILLGFGLNDTFFLFAAGIHGYILEFRHNFSLTGNLMIYLK